MTACPRIRTIGEAEATGAVKEFYDKLRHERGTVAKLYQALSLKPEAMEVGGGRESHGAVLRQVTQDRTLAEQLKRDYRAAPIPGRERSILDFAVKLTHHPAEIGDEEILDVVLIASYYNFINRVSNPLGAEPEELEVAALSAAHAAAEAPHR